MFASNGEKLTDFDLFHPDRMAGRILDMGDMLTLIEQAEKTFDQDRPLKAAEKLSGKGGDFTLDDFLEQMQQVRKLGSMSKIMGMLPGMGQFRDQLAELRRPRDRPDPGDHPVDDPGRAGQPQAHRRVAPGPDRQGLRAHRSATSTCSSTGSSRPAR